MCERLIRDTAWAIAVSIMECIENCLRPEERRDAVHEIYHRVRAGIEAAEQMAQREQVRLAGASSRN